MPISWGFIYSHVIYACFTYDVYFTCDMYFVFHYALARESTTFVVLRHSCTFLHCIYLHYWSYTSLRLMLFVVKTTWNKAYSILFYSILYNRNDDWLNKNPLWFPHWFHIVIYHARCHPQVTSVLLDCAEWVNSQYLLDPQLCTHRPLNGSP